MNRTFRLIWNVAQGRFVVASETAKSKRKSPSVAIGSVLKLAAPIALTFGLTTTPSAWAADYATTDTGAGWKTGSTDFWTVDGVHTTGPATSAGFQDTVTVLHDGSQLSGDPADVTVGQLSVGGSGRVILEINNGNTLTANTQNLNSDTAISLANLSGYGENNRSVLILIGNNSEINIVEGETILGGIGGQASFNIENNARASLQGLTVNDGDVTVRNSSLETDTINLAAFRENYGTYLLLDGGSTLNALTPAEIHLNGMDNYTTAQLRIGENSTANATTLTLGDYSSVELDGTGSRLNADSVIVNGTSSDVELTRGGVAILSELTINDSGSVYVDNESQLNASQVKINDHGSLTITPEDISSADTGGDIEISDGGTLTVSNALSTLEVGSNNLRANSLIISGTGGTLNADTIELQTDGSGNGSDIQFNHTASNYQFDPAIIGSLDTSLNFNTGTTTLNSDLSNFSGDININGGKTIIAGSMGDSSVNVNGGTLSIGADQNLVVSSFNQSAGTLQIDLDSVNGVVHYGKLTASDLDLAADDITLDINVIDASALTDNQILNDVISAPNGIYSSSYTVIDNSALFDFTSSISNDNLALDLTAHASSQSGVADYVTQQGLKQGMNAARVLDDVISNPDNHPGGTEISTTMGQLTTGGEVAEAVKESLPSIGSEVTETTQSTLQSNSSIIRNRQATTSGLASGDGFIANKNVWLKPIGSRANQGKRKGIDGYDADTYGMIGGIDGDLNDHSSLGFAVAYINSSLDSHGSAKQSADIDMYQLAAYGQQDLGRDNLFIDWQADISYGKTDGKRDLDFAGTQAKSDYDSYTGHVGAGLGKTFELSAQTRFVPAIRADYTYIHNDSYSEKGAGAFNLNVDSDNVDEFITTLEGSLYHDFSNQLSVSANAGIGYDFIDDDTDIVASYAGGGSSFTTEGRDRSRIMLTGGLGLNYQASDTFNIAANYDVEGRSDYLNQTVSAKLTWAF